MIYMKYEGDAADKKMRGGEGLPSLTKYNVIYG